jgi:hypothetical protein
MEYGTLVENNVENKHTPKIHDERNTRHVLWNTTSDYDNIYFSQTTIDIISRQVTQNLMGVMPGNKPIKVTDRVINNTMNNVYEDRMGRVADIYTIFTVLDHAPENSTQSLIDRCIEIISSNIRTEYEMIENNSKLTKWTTVLGDFNTQGLRSHSTIYTREKNTNNRGKVSFMNY